MWVVDVITGTGMRPHEVFALLLEGIDLDAPEPYLDVTGTLVEVKGKMGAQTRPEVRQRVAAHPAACPHRRARSRCTTSPTAPPAWAGTPVAGGDR